jgi:hypothetical protein
VGSTARSAKVKQPGENQMVKNKVTFCVLYQQRHLPDGTRPRPLLMLTGFQLQNKVEKGVKPIQNCEEMHNGQKMNTFSVNIFLNHTNLIHVVVRNYLLTYSMKQSPS